MKAILCIGSLVGLLGSIAVACSSTPAVPPPPDNSVAVFCTDWAAAKCQLSTLCQFDVGTCRDFPGRGVQHVRDQRDRRPAPGSTTSRTARRASISSTRPTAAAPRRSPRPPTPPRTTPATSPSSATRRRARRARRTTTASQASPARRPSAGTKVCESVTPRSWPIRAATRATSAREHLLRERRGGPHVRRGPRGRRRVHVAYRVRDQRPARLDATCEPLAAVGGLCATDDDCASSLFCDPYPSGTGAITCASALTFAKGADDCRGIGGLNERGHGRRRQRGRLGPRPTPGHVGGLGDGRLGDDRLLRERRRGRPKFSARV